MSELPEEVVDEAERLTRLMRAAVDDNERTAYRERRRELLADHGFTARVREADDTLVCHPDEWVVEGDVQLECIEDTGRAVERSLSGAGDPDDWESVAAHNDRVVEAVAAHGETHGANARAFADFMSNHYARRVESATEREIEEFHTEYFVRNAWPTDEQRDVVETSLSLVFAEADALDAADE
ncbi:DUF7108 family protein [Halococcus sp. AFM35]|uniref:DUF7108 family protein n=1 Tax=Halococcus sp. AFM35 TaxID=3421653 RepID=UPI003EBDCA4E